MLNIRIEVSNDGISELLAVGLCDFLRGKDLKLVSDRSYLSSTGESNIVFEEVVKVSRAKTSPIAPLSVE